MSQVQEAANKVPPHVSRRFALALALSGATVGLAAACAPAASPTPLAATVPPVATKPAAAPSPSAAAVASPSPAAQPKSGGRLRMSADQFALLATAIEPHQNTSPTFLAHDTLIRYDARRNPLPALAESWDLSSDQKQLRLNLRKGVQFHNGRTLTSEDVKYNLLRVRDPKVGASQLRFMSSWFEAIDTPDASTVVMRSDQPRPAVFDLLEFLSIANKDTQDQVPVTKADGTGPFKLAEWTPGVRIRWAKNPSYWQSGRPYLDEIDLTFVSDAQAATIQLEAGALDATWPSTRDAARLRQDAKYRVHLSGTPGTSYMISANTLYPPLADKRVRQALQFALDRKRFADTVLLKTVDPRVLPWPPQSPAFDDSKNSAYDFDLDKARSLLASAGVTDLRLDYQMLNSIPEYAELGPIYQADLAKIGVTMTLKPFEPAALASLYQPAPAYNGFLSSQAGFNGVEPSSLFLISAYYNPFGANTSGYKGDRYVDLLNRVSVEPDANRRKQMYTDLSDLIIDEAFSLAIANKPYLMATTAAVQGVNWRVNERVVYEDIWLQ
jgi:peptide/nickel transport system substrate-binding protein